MAPGTIYDPAVPTLVQVVGHDFHEEITAFPRSRSTRGRTSFAEDPTYRACAEATQLLFINAVLLGPGK